MGANTPMFEKTIRAYPYYTNRELREQDVESQTDILARGIAEEARQRAAEARLDAAMLRAKRMAAAYGPTIPRPEATHKLKPTPPQSTRTRGDDFRLMWEKTKAYFRPFVRKFVGLFIILKEGTK